MNNSTKYTFFMLIPIIVTSRIKAAYNHADKIHGTKCTYSSSERSNAAIQNFNALVRHLCYLWNNIMIICCQGCMHVFSYIWWKEFSVTSSFIWYDFISRYIVKMLSKVIGRAIKLFIIKFKWPLFREYVLCFKL